MLITYYWPPAGGGGVQRWLKFCKYLREYGVEPVIYTPSNPDYPAVDESLSEEILIDTEVWTYPIWEPYKLYRVFTGQPADKRIYSGFITDNEKETLSQKISVFIRGNLFIPDARKFWIKPSVKHLTEKLKDKYIDLIISTGPPHSMHLIAEGVAKNTGIPWIADFRDPWTGIDFYEHLRLTKWADRIHHQKERKVLKAADAVVTVSPYCVDHLEHLSDRKVHLITNGYDENDFLGASTLTKAFTVTHVGSVNGDRNPIALWEALEELLEKIPQMRQDLKLNFIGPTDKAVQSTIDSFTHLSKCLHVTQWLDHKDAVVRIRESQVLLLLVNDTPHTRGLLPGKLFEYLAARRPIIGVGPENGDAAKLIHQSRGGDVIEFQDKQRIKEKFEQYYNQYLDGSLAKPVESQNVEQYGRKSLGKSYATLVKEILAAKSSA